MIESKQYENFPFWIVLLSNLVSLSIYILGYLILFHLGWYFSIFYLIYILFLEYRLIGKHCVNCYYWGKTCGFGKGRLSALFFKKGDNTKFCTKEFTWKNMIPDLLVSLIPLITGIVLIIIKFNLLVLLFMILILLLSSVVTGFIRSSLACKFCKQRELGCLAEKLFNKEK